MFQSRRLSKIRCLSLVVSGFAALAIVLPGSFASAQELTAGEAREFLEVDFESSPVHHAAPSPQLSEKVRKQIFEELLKGTHDPDADVANRSFAGLARVADAEMAAQALVALLNRPAATKDERLQKLHFAACLLAHGIAREKVLSSVLEAAAAAEDAAVRFRAINVLLFAQAGNTSADVVRMLIATVKNPDSGLDVSTPHNRPRDSSNAAQWAVDRPAVKSLIARAAGYKTGSEADRAERVISAFLIAMQLADEARVEAEFAALVARYNLLVKRDRWPEAMLVSERVREIAPASPIATIMYEKARIGRQVARNAHLKEHRDEEADEEHGDENADKEHDALLAPAPRDSELIASAAVSAIAHIVPQTDEVALALLEALKLDDARIHRAASLALANAMHGSTEGSSSGR